MPAMKVFVFDLLPYAEHLDHLKVGKELPWPLAKQHFKPEVAVQTYAEHLDAWEELDRLGFDGVGFNEHHTSPYGLMNSPNLLAAAAAQRTRNLKLLILGNLLPIHDPLRLAEELAMLDCLSNGRLISGFARGIAREHNVYGVPLGDSRARFEEAWEIVRHAWTDEVFSYEGRFWSYHDVAMWPRPVQQPYPPVWVPVTSSKETIEWAAQHDIPVIPGARSQGLKEDVVRYYGECLEQSGHVLTTDSVITTADVHIADSKAEAVQAAGPYRLYFNTTLFAHGNERESGALTQAGYLTATSQDYLRPENRRAAAGVRDDHKDLTLDDIARQVEREPWGTADEVRERIIASADNLGANTVLVSMNRGAMPHAMFMDQIRRFAADVLPALQAHEVRAATVA
jgi:alkanesulfonate monooxygenase SsuD/methylene tetrahydromethanopterin reductase-like flavin-dependent oxidoreductase (luciferase family)